MEHRKMLANSLAGIRVLDMTRHYPGPLCTLMLADLGADVIKVEAPKGDPARFFPPYEFGTGAGFLQWNRGKRSVTLNLKRPEAAAICLRLLKTSDVLVESFRPGVMARWNIDYESLRTRHPALIYCSITGYGQQGPYSEKPGHDLNYVSIAGIISLTGNNQKGYLIPPVQIADAAGAFQAVSAILAALFERTRTQQGQLLDISLLDGAFFTLIGIAGFYLSRTPSPAGPSPLSGKLSCYRLYRTRDEKYLALALLEPKFWETFCRKANLEACIIRQFQENQDELIEILSNRIASRNLHEWLELFEGEENICMTPVKEIAEAVSDAQTVYRQMLLDIRYGSETFRQIRTPFVQNPSATSPAPRLGEHNEDLLQELGYSPDEITRFREEEII